MRRLRVCSYRTPKHNFQEKRRSSWTVKVVLSRFDASNLILFAQTSDSHRTRDAHQCDAPALVGLAIPPFCLVDTASLLVAAPAPFLDEPTWPHEEQLSAQLTFVTLQSPLLTLLTIRWFYFFFFLGGTFAFPRYS